MKWGEVGHSLKAKLSVLITAVLVLAIVLVVIVLQRQQQESLTAEMTKRGRAIAENLAAGAKTSLLQRDDLTLTVLVKDAMKDGDIRYIIIADENGQIRAHSDLNKIGDQVERPAPLAPARDELTVTSYRSSRGGIIDFAVPLTFSRVRLGALYLGFSEESIVPRCARRDGRPPSSPWAWSLSASQRRWAWPACSRVPSSASWAAPAPSRRATSACRCPSPRTTSSAR